MHVVQILNASIIRRCRAAHLVTLMTNITPLVKQLILVCDVPAWATLHILVDIPYVGTGLVITEA